MGIFDGANLSFEQTQELLIREKNKNVLNGEIGRCKSTFEDIWGAVGNPLSIEVAQAVLDRFTAQEQVQMFTVHSAWQDFITLAVPEYVRLVPPYKPTFGENGITLTAWTEEELMAMGITEQQKINMGWQSA
jgi:hypothetical protein